MPLGASSWGVAGVKRSNTGIQTVRKTYTGRFSPPSQEHWTQNCNWGSTVRRARAGVETETGKRCNDSVPKWPRIARARAALVALRASTRTLIRKLQPRNESQHLFALTLVVGVVCGLVAVAFHLALRAAEKLLIERALHAPGWSWMVWTVVTPTLGGLAAGAALTWIVPGARGSGIPQVKQAFAIEGGRIRFRDAFGKFILAVLQIGSGASLGREGPTVQICAGAASALARATSLPPRNMRRLTPVGVAAGIAAAFNAPIAAVTFTIEEIVGALDHTVLSGVVVAAALAAVIERSILGVHPVIEVAQVYGLDHPSSLALFALLGVTAAVVSVVFTDALLLLRIRFRKLKAIPGWTQPAVGGLVTGILAVVALHFFGTNGVTGGGYETLGRALAGALGIKVLLALGALKVVATTFSYSSGGAGGIFAPSLFIGAMLGGAIGYLDVNLFHHESRQLGAFALVGMGAVFAGVIRAPITSVLIIFEMTGSYGLVLPLMLANMTAYGLARRWRPVPIYEALLAQDGVVLPHAIVPGHAVEPLRVPAADRVLSELTARGLMSAVKVVDGASRLGELTAMLGDTESSALLLREHENRFSVLIPEHLVEFARDEHMQTILVAADLACFAPTIDPDEDLFRVARAMADSGANAVVVIDRQTLAPLGIVTKARVGLALLDWHASQPVPEKPVSSAGDRGVPN